jgi:hypothetical protein
MEGKGQKKDGPATSFPCLLHDKRVLLFANPHLTPIISFLLVINKLSVSTWHRIPTRTRRPKLEFPPNLREVFVFIFYKYLKKNKKNLVFLL